MDFALRKEGFMSNPITIRTSAFNAPAVFQNKAEIKKNQGVYQVVSDLGEGFSIKLKPRAWDPVPKVVVGNELVEIAEPLAWYEVILVILPFFLITGGAIGGLLGGVGVLLNRAIIRSELSTLLRYCSAITVFVAAFAAFTWAVAAIRHF